METQETFLQQNAVQIIARSDSKSPGTSWRILILALNEGFSC